MSREQKIVTVLALVGLTTSFWTALSTASSASSPSNLGDRSSSVELTDSENTPSAIAQFSAPVSPVVNGQANLTVTGTGYVSAPADRAFLQMYFYSSLPVEYDGTQPIEPITDADVAFVVDALTDLGIPANEVTVYPDPASYGSARVQVQVAQPTAERLNEIVTGVNDAVVADGRFSPGGSSVIYTVDQCSTVEDQARRKAIADAQSRATALAAAAGVEMAGILSLSEYFTWNYGYSTNCPNSDHAATSFSQYGGYPFDPTVAPEVNVSSQITATYAIGSE
ncbi:MAG: hypothetical protein Kow00121_13970 [Elainellaceae cyanobacterium]